MDLELSSTNASTVERDQSVGFDESTCRSLRNGESELTYASVLSELTDRSSPDDARRFRCRSFES